MAYAFSKIQNLVAGEESNQNSANIFGEEGEESQEPINYQSAKPKMSIPGVNKPGQVFGQKTAEENKDIYAPKESTFKTTTAGDLPVAKQSASVSWKNPIQESQADADAIAASNQTNVPQAFVDLQNQVSSNQAALQQKADDYIKNYQQMYDDTDYGKLATDFEAYYSDPNNDTFITRAADGTLSGGVDTLNRAILDSSSKEYQDLSNFLQFSEANPQMIDRADRFEGANDFYVDDINMLSSDAGLRNLASRGMGPQYTSGMGNYDLMMMKKDPNFQNLINQIKSENVALESGIEKNPEILEQGAEDYGLGRLEYAQTQGRDYLDDFYQGLKDENTAEAEAYRTQIQDLIDDKGNIVYDALYGDATTGIDQDVLDAVQSATDYSEARYDDVTNQALEDFDPRQYDESGNVILDESGNVVYDPEKIKELSETLNLRFADPSQLTYADFLDESEASQLTNVGGLMGGGNAYVESMPLGDDYTLDENMLQRAIIEEIANAREAKDIESRSQQREILDDIEKDYFDYMRNMGTAQTGYNAAIQKEIDDWIAKQEGSVAGLDLADAIVQPSYDYYNEALRPGVSPTESDFLTQDQVDALHALNEDMYGQVGFGGNYTAGGGIGSEYLPDISSMINAEGGYAGLSEQDKIRLEGWLEQQYRDSINQQIAANNYVPPDPPRSIAQQISDHATPSQYIQDRLQPSEEVRGRASAPKWLRDQLEGKKRKK